MHNAVTKIHRLSPELRTRPASQVRQQIALFESLEGAHKRFLSDTRSHAQRAFSTFVQPLCDSRMLAFEVTEAGSWSFQSLLPVQAHGWPPAQTEAPAYDDALETALEVLNHPVPGMDGISLGSLMDSYNPVARSAQHFLRVVLDNASEHELTMIQRSLSHLYKLKTLNPFMPPGHAKPLLIDQMLSRALEQKASGCDSLGDIHAFLGRLERNLRVSFARDVPPYTTAQSAQAGYCLNMTTGECHTL